jgi:hypothetical protein
MAAYLDAYADAFELREFIRFRAAVERLELDPSAGWWLTLDDGSVRRYRAVVVAIGLFWCPKVPAYPGAFGGVTIHSHEYRTPGQFEGRRVLVVGAGQSAAEIAVEVSRLAARTLMAVRSRTHLLPRWIGGKPYDTGDIDPLNRISWRLLNFVYGLRVARELGPTPASWPVGVHRLLEGIPIVSSDLLPAVLEGDIVVKPAIDRLRQDRVHFVDSSEEMVDCIIYCTGYCTSLPFLSSSLVSANGRDFPLYRRIVPPDIGGLFSAGFVDAPGGLLPVVEAQGEWIAAVLAGQLPLPTQKRMWQAIERPERRTRQRFPGKTRTASGAIRTRTGGCYSLTSGARAQVTREAFDFTDRRPGYRPRGDGVAGRVRYRELAVNCQSLTARKVSTAAGSEDEPDVVSSGHSKRHKHSGHASEYLPIIGAWPRLTCSRHWPTPPAGRSSTSSSSASRRRCSSSAPGSR